MGDQCPDANNELVIMQKLKNLPRKNGIIAPIVSRR
jgi:hypothetical protein